MGKIDMGVDFAKAEKDAGDAIAPAVPNVYDIQVTGHELGNNKNGGPRIMFSTVIVNSPDPKANGKKMNYFCNLPNEGDMTGVGFLTQFLAAIGNPWKGSSFDPDTCTGLTAKANVSVSPDGKWNNIDSFV